MSDTSAVVYHMEVAQLWWLYLLPFWLFLPHDNNRTEQGHSMTGFVLEIMKLSFKKDNMRREVKTKLRSKQLYLDGKHFLLHIF